MNCICDEIQDLMHANPEIQTGAGMFAWVTLEDQDYITFLRVIINPDFGVTG